MTKSPFKVGVGHFYSEGTGDWKPRDIFSVSRTKVIGIQTLSISNVVTNRSDAAIRILKMDFNLSRSALEISHFRFYLLYFYKSNFKKKIKIVEKSFSSSYFFMTNSNLFSEFVLRHYIGQYIGNRKRL